MGSWWPLMLALSSCVMYARLLSSWIPCDASNHSFWVLWSLRKQHAARRTGWLELMMSCCCQHSYLWGFFWDLPIGCGALSDWSWLSLRSPSPPTAPVTDCSCTPVSQPVLPLDPATYSSLELEHSFFKYVRELLPHFVLKCYLLRGTFFECSNELFLSFFMSRPYFIFLYPAYPA